MTSTEYWYFAFLGVFFVFWFIVNGAGMIAPDRVLRTWWGEFAYRNMSAKRVRLLSAVFLVIAIGFVGHALWNLSNGTFKLRGNPKTFGFSDFFRPTK